QIAHLQLTEKKLADKRKSEEKQVQAKIAKLAITSPSHKAEFPALQPETPSTSHTNQHSPSDTTNPFPYFEDIAFIKCENVDTESNNDRFLDEAVKEEDEERYAQFYAETAVEYGSESEKSDDEYPEDAGYQRKNDNL
ncbi:unnamed protein product, partial [Allacma fusca]